MQSVQVTPTGLQVAAWPEGTSLRREEAARRQRYLRATYIRGSTAREPLQAGRDLASIPVGTVVVAHLLRSAHHAIPAHKRFLVGALGLGPDRNPERGRRGVPKVANVGKTSKPFKWRSDMASKRWQQATRYVYFDAGDAVLDAALPTVEADLQTSRVEFRDGAGPMTVDSYNVSGGEAVRILVADEVVHVEPHTGSFGITWSTDETLSSAISKLRPVLEAPLDDDPAWIAGDQDLRVKTTTALALQELEGEFRDARFARLQFGRAVVTWSRDDLDSPHAELGLGLTVFSRTQLRKALGATASAKLAKRTSEVADRADTILSRFV